MQTTSSTKNLRIRSTQQRSPSLSSSPKKKFDHKKQIEATLNQLHQLQAQIYNLNVPQNPHSSGPLKKQIKQLSYLYESMTKPKTKNKLNVDLKDIKSSIKIINEGFSAIQMKANKKKKKINHQESQKKAVEISLLKDFTVVQQKKHDQNEQNSNIIQAKKLKQLMKSMFGTEFDLSLVSQTKTSKINQLTAEQIQKFINYNEFDKFDPLEQAYKCLLDDNGNFSFKKYNQINQMFGLPTIKQLGILKSALGVDQKQQMSFDTFKKIISEGEQLGFV